MDFFEAVKKRVSVREYSDKVLEKETIEKIIDAGRLAPTARMVEPWEFIVTTQRETLKKLGAIADHGKFIAQAAACITIFCKETKYCLEDGCAATENILLAAASQGVASCWVAGDKKDYSTDVAKTLGVPEEYKLICLISLGYPKVAPVAKNKRALDDVLHWERF